MADSLRNSPVSDALSNSYSSAQNKDDKNHNHSKTFSNGDVITSFHTSSNRKRGSLHEETNPRKDAESMEHGGDLRPRIGSSASDDALVKTAHALSRSSMLKSQSSLSSFSNEVVKGKRNGGTESRSLDVFGFVIVSWKIRHFSQLEKALRPGKFSLFHILYR